MTTMIVDCTKCGKVYEVESDEEDKMHDYMCTECWDNEYVLAPCSDSLCNGKRYGAKIHMVKVKRKNYEYAICDECFCRNI